MIKKKKIINEQITSNQIVTRDTFKRKGIMNVINLKSKNIRRGVLNYAFRSF